MKSFFKAIMEFLGICLKILNDIFIQSYVQYFLIFLCGVGIGWTLINLDKTVDRHLVVITTEHNQQLTQAFKSYFLVFDANAEIPLSASQPNKLDFTKSHNDWLFQFFNWLGLPNKPVPQYIHIYGYANMDDFYEPNSESVSSDELNLMVANERAKRAKKHLKRFVDNESLLRGLVLKVCEWDSYQNMIQNRPIRAENADDFELQKYINRSIELVPQLTDECREQITSELPASFSIADTFQPN